MPTKPKGGRRPGSGRPRVDSVGVNFRLRRETLEWIDAQAGRRSEVVERLVNEKRDESESIQIMADFDDPASIIRWKAKSGDRWEHTPFQVDTFSDPAAALEGVKEWSKICWG